MSHCVEEQKEVGFEQDIEEMYELYNEYRSQFKVSINYSFEEFKYFMWNENVKVFVIRNTKENKIVDFVSYYKYQMSIKNSDDVFNCTRMFLFTCLCEEITLLGANTIRLIAQYDADCDMFWSNDLNSSKDYILATPSKPDEESDEDEHKKAYELKFVKYSSVKYINTFNYRIGMVNTFQVIYTDQ